MGRDTKGRFVKGQSGNPEGRPSSGDGWASALTGIGTSARDKRLSHTFNHCTLSIQEIAYLWDKDDITSKAIEAPAEECFREGYEIMIGDEGSYDDLKEEIEEELVELEADKALKKAYSNMRAYGGSALLLGVDDRLSLDKPLEIDRVRGVDSLRVLEPIELIPLSSYEDPTKANFGEPEYFQLNNFGTSTGPSVFGTGGKGKSRQPKPNSVVRIHESRLIIFNGIKVSNYYRQQSQLHQFWGSSVVDRFHEVLRDCNVGYAGAGLLATDVSQPIITIQGLREMVARNEDKFRARMAALELSRSNARAIILDEKEKFERQTTNLSGIPDLLDRLSIRLAAAIGIPLSVLFGYSPATLGAPSDSEMVQWYNKIRTIQRQEMTPVLRTLTKMIMRTLRQRKIPKKWGIKWGELEHLSAVQLAEARLTQSRTDSMYIKAGVLTPDEVRRSRFVGEYSFETQVKEKDKAPGFAAPVPAGVIPGSTPAAGGKPMGPNAHSVTSYARRNPTQPALGKNTPEGGDATPKNDRQDAIATYAELAASAGFCEFAGFDICIENPKGSTREWVDTDGTAGSTKMKYDYGYIENSVGSDGDEVDVYIGPNEDAEWVYVIHQNSKASNFEKYDEDKVLIGFDSPNHAHDAYLRQYDDERFYGGMSVMSVDEFREKVMRTPGQITNG